MNTFGVLGPGPSWLMMEGLVAQGYNLSSSSYFGRFEKIRDGTLPKTERNHVVLLGQDNPTDLPTAEKYRK